MYDRKKLTEKKHRKKAIEKNRVKKGGRDEAGRLNRGN
jgi:hypothetical protein